MQHLFIIQLTGVWFTHSAMLCWAGKGIALAADSKRSLIQAEKAAQQDAIAAKTPSRPQPPTAVLGFAPPSKATPAPIPTSGKFSWPVNFFSDGSRKKRICQATSSKQDSDAASRVESVDSGAVSSHVGNGDGTAGIGMDKNFGAAWRDAAQSPSPTAPAHSTGVSASHNSLQVLFLFHPSFPSFSL